MRNLSRTNPILKNLAEKVVGPVIRFFNFPLAYLAGKSENLEKAILPPVIKSYTNQSKDWIIQYTKLPKDVEKISIELPNDVRFADYAIVLQGPVRTEKNFTVETVKYYKRCYPGVTVIVSTWTESDTTAKAEAEKLGAIWIESEPPEMRGAGNVNMQLASSLAGMKKAKSLGCKYAMKTRTDHRFYAADVLQYFRNLQMAFPSENTEMVSDRIVFISYRWSFRYFPFFLCDHATFGTIDELIKLYSVERDVRPNNFHKKHEKEERDFIVRFNENMEVRNSGSPYELYTSFEDLYYRYMFTEIYIVYHYFTENIGHINPGDDLMDAYYWFLKKFAIVADAEKMMVYWPKYSLGISQVYNEFTNEGKLDFKKWLEIYLHYEPKKDWSVRDANTVRAEEETI